MRYERIEALTDSYMQDIERGNYRCIESVLTDEKTYVLPLSLVQMARAEAMDAGGILNPLDMLSEYPLEDTFSYLDVSLDDGRFLINPGSVGQPRNGDNRSSYVILEGNDEAGYTVPTDLRDWSATFTAHLRP